MVDKERSKTKYMSDLRGVYLRLAIHYITDATYWLGRDKPQQAANLMYYAERALADGRKKIRQLLEEGKL